MSDYIERDKAIDKLRRRKALFCKNQIEFKLLPTNDKSRVDEIDACIAMLINMLPEDVQPVVHGEWINTMEGNAFRDKCSECESLYPNAFGYNWCPNCGAKMDKRKGAGE